MPKAHKTLLQSRLINSPPVNGMIKAEDGEEGCEGFLVGDPGTAVLVGVLVTLLPGTVVGVLVGVLVAVAPGTLVGVLVGVLVGGTDVLVGVSVGVLVGVAPGILVGVFVGVLVGVLVAVAPGT